MAAVTVQLFATLREVTGTSRLRVEATSVREVLSSLCVTYGDTLRRHLFTPGGQLQETIAVLVNGRNIRFVQGLDTELRSGDVVTLIPPVAGGAGPQHSRVEMVNYALPDRGKRGSRIYRRHHYPAPAPGGAGDRGKR